MQGSSQSLLEWGAHGQDRWERLEKGTLLDSQLLEAAWLLSVLCQQGTTKLPVFALGEQAAMPWCSLPAGLVLCPHACTHSWLWVCPTPCQGAATCISSLPLRPGSLFVTHPNAEATQMDAVKFSSCFPALPLNGLALCSLPMNMHSYAQVCCQLLPSGQARTQSRSLLVGQVQAVRGATSGGPLGRRGGCRDSRGAALCCCRHPAVHRCSEEPLMELVASVI